MGSYYWLRASLSLALAVALIVGLFGSITVSSQAQPIEVTIGALYPITGDLASFGKANVEALRIALDDVNKWFADNGYPWRFKLDIRDSETKPETAKSVFRTMHTAGVRYFLGPMSSGELKEIMAEIQAGLKAVVISPSSTAPGLALKDTVFRFPPPDEFQGRVLNMLFKNDKVTHLIIVYRNDDWGKGLADFVEKFSKDFGITIVNKVPYDPKAPAFGPVVETLRSDVERVSRTVPLENIGIDIIAFEEGVGLLVEASKVDILTKVKWYGSDGTSLSAELLKNPVAAKFASDRVWKNTITFAATDIAIKIYWTIKDKLGYSPDPYSFISYDCMWVMALAIAQAGAEAGGKLPDPEKVAEKIPEILKTYVGASGKIQVNEFGDRAGSDYGIFAPVEVSPGKFEWRLLELYDFAKDAIVSVPKDPFAERPAVLPVALPTFAPPAKPPTPTPTPAPAVPWTTIAAIIVILIIIALLAYYMLGRR